MAAKFLVVQGPQFAEDEGRHLVLATANTKKQAQQLCDKQHRDSGGFYCPSVYKRIGE